MPEVRTKHETIIDVTGKNPSSRLCYPIIEKNYFLKT